MSTADDPVRTPVVSLLGITKRWPGGGGLAPLGAAIPAGSLTVVRGRSGSGKSTLLAILAGWCPPDGGEIHWADPATATSWSGRAVVPQVLGLTPELSVRENVGLPLRSSGMRRTIDADPRVDELLAALDLVELADRLPREISMGQRQRVAVARALVLRPSLALVDEPTSHQDAGHALTVVELLHLAAVADGTAVVVASHDPGVVALADQVIDLDHLVGGG